MFFLRAGVIDIKLGIEWKTGSPRINKKINNRRSIGKFSFYTFEPTFWRIFPPSSRSIYYNN